MGLEEFKQAVPLLKAGEPQWEEFYWLRLHVVVFPNAGHERVEE